MGPLLTDTSPLFSRKMMSIERANTTTGYHLSFKSSEGAGMCVCSIGKGRPQVDSVLFRK